ncbi:MAG: hemerythrin domain-containing protein [Planctomycetes bacterium]|nr:hemerythrin domain-containing protein [Planctomycetota bacterium]
MRRMTYGLLVLGTGLGMALVARERRGVYESEAAGPASRQLMAEHEVILEVLRAAQTEADHARQGFNLDDNRVRDIVDFSRNFTDRCHHGKEERFYFPAAEVYAGQRVYGFVDELMTEHAYGRSIMDEIDYLLGGDAGEAATLIAERLSAYVSTMRRHIQRENQQLYQKSATFLPGAEEQALLVGFDRIERVDLGMGFHERYHRLAETLGEGLRQR